MNVVRRRKVNGTYLDVNPGVVDFGGSHSG